MKIGYWFFLCVVFFILGIIMGADYNKSNNHENVSAVIATPYRLQKDSQLSKEIYSLYLK